MKQDMKTKTVKMNIPMCLACILLCLTMFSAAMVSGLYARYTAGNTAEDAARVAAFSVTETGDVLTQELRLHIDPDTPAEVIVTVKNDSETAVRYRMEANNPFENLPLQFDLDEPTAYEIAPGKTAECTLTVSWSGAADVRYAGRVDLIELTLTAEQID